MAKSKHKILEGALLLSFLTDSICNLPIKLIEVSGNMIGYVSRDQAMVMLRSGQYMGKCGTSRVLYIRQIDERAPNPPDPSYWDGRACGLYRWWNDTSAQGTNANRIKAWSSWYNKEVETPA